MPVRMTSQHIIVDGRRVSYLDASHGDNGRAIVFLHAFPLHAGMWAPQLEAIPPGWRGLAPDFRGFGLSDGDPEASGGEVALDDFATDVARLLDSLNITDAVFCGLSMGGYTLFPLLRLCPERIAGIVMADTKAAGDSQAGVAGRVAMLEKLKREGAAAITAQMLPGLLGETSKRERPAVVQEVTRLMGAASAGAIGHAIRRMMRRGDSTPMLAGIRCPTLVLVGEEDTLTPLPDSQALHRAIPASSLAIIAGAGHLSNLERPGTFNAELGRFLSALPSERQSRDR
jgi:3-oxoadipate enol-lactonase